MEAADLPGRPLADKFLYLALVPVNAYKCAKFQLPSSISYWDMEGSQIPTSVPYFNFLARLVSDIWGGSQNKKWELLISPDTP